MYVKWNYFLTLLLFFWLYESKDLSCGRFHEEPHLHYTLYYLLKITSDTKKWSCSLLTIKKPKLMTVSRQWLLLYTQYAALKINIANWDKKKAWPWLRDIRSFANSKLTNQKVHEDNVFTVSWNYIWRNWSDNGKNPILDDASTFSCESTNIEDFSFILNSSFFLEISFCL